VPKEIGGTCLTADTALVLVKNEWLNDLFI
jgi:hypothetical protein